MSTTPKAGDSFSPVKRAILELRRARSRIEELQRAKNEPIAITGIGLRFPGRANNMDSLWQLLRDGVDAITEVPFSRWDINAFYDRDPDAPGKMSTRWGGFLEDVDTFDADFFGISAREAVAMDPQHRLLLVTAWEALENAGEAPQHLMGSSTGVFVGISSSDYWQLQLQRLMPEDIDPYFATGVIHSVASGRLSYFLGLQGPSISIDTACSSSLVAVHLACQSLRAGECNLALAGGVNLILAPELTINFTKARMMAADGRCKVFDAAADGYVRSEGAGMIVLKRLSDAMRDGDRILALVRGSAVNQDGRTNGLTAPNGPSQQAVIRQALRNAGVEPAQLSYVETHGTGTALGDPIEVQALAAALGENRPPEKPLAIASIKTNIGHLEAAAGIAGLVKVILALQHEAIPPHLHFKEPNPYIAWKDLPITIPTSLVSWPAQSARRIAGVSSFGFSGTNAHVVVEEAPEGNRENMVALAPAETRDGSPGRSLFLLNLSAKTESALKELAGCYGKWLADPHKFSLADLCYTANAGRNHFEHRLSILASSTGEMREKLAAFVSGEEVGGVWQGRWEGASRPEIVFCFPGQIDRYANPTRTLFESEPSFRTVIERCDAWLRPCIEQPLLAALYPEPGACSPAGDAAWARAVVFAIEYALADLWRSWGIEPALVVGQGLGEAVAAAVAGIISLEDGLRLATCLGDERERLASEINFQSPSIAFFPLRSLKIETDAHGFRAACARQDSSDPVQWDQAIEAICRNGCRIFVEIGSPPIGQMSRETYRPPASAVWLSSLRPGRDDREQMLETLAALYVQGADVNWKSFHGRNAARKIPLPTYPFEPRRLWIETKKTQDRPPSGMEQPEIWETAVAAAGRQSRQAPLDLALHTYEAKWRSLDRLAAAYMFQTLRQLGVFAGAQSYSIEALSARCGIIPTYRVLVARWVKKLIAEGWLQSKNGSHAPIEPEREIPTDTLLSEAKEHLSDIPFILNYLEHCGQAAGQVITGRLNALETLFPAGSTEFAEKLYEDWAFSRYFNGIAGAAVEGVAKNWPRGQLLKCIEIGGGTGGTTASVLPVLPADRTSYYFTDVSAFFFGRAAEKFRVYPFVNYDILDVEKDPAEQGYRPHDFNIVIAANVLHATRNIRETIRRVASLLAPGGLLVLYEVTRPPAWFDISIALIEGWQLFDDGLRQDSPLLSVTQWRNALRTAGFADVDTFPQTGSPADILGCHVVLARMPGALGARPSSYEDAPERDLAGSASPPEKGADAAVGSASEVLQCIRDGSETERRDLFVEYVRGHVSNVLGREGSRPIGRHQRLMDLGIDSLMAVQLRNVLGRGLGLAQPLPATLIFDYPTIEAIAEYLERQTFAHENSASAEALPPEGETGDSNVPDKLAGLSGEQVASLLLKKLETL